MLQEATKIINSGIQKNIIKKLSLYLHDCVREEFQSSTFRNLNQDKDTKWVFLNNEVTQEALLLKEEDAILKLDGADSKITEIMLQADNAQKDKYLIYGHLFLIGKNPRRKREQFLTPILYTPCKLERNGINIDCSLADDKLSLNTGALASLMQYDDEDDVEHLFEGLIDVVPELPLTEDGIQVFLTTLKSIIPDIDIDNIVNETVTVASKSALILTKRPTVTAGLLHELTKISEKPVGVFRETALSAIQEESFYKPINKKNSSLINNSKPNREFIPITPLQLSDTQALAIKSAEENVLTTVYGPPGTGKSQTIVNMAAHLVASGKTVLIASRMDKAVDVVTERLNSFGAPYLALRAGRANYQKQLNFQLQDLISDKVNLDDGFESAVLVENNDMQALMDEIKQVENSYEKIVKLEENWFKTLKEFKKQKNKLENNLIIKIKLSLHNVELANNLTTQLEKNLNSSGLLGVIASVKSSVIESKLKKLLQIDEIEKSEEFIEDLRENLKLKELEANLKKIENDINKIGNLNEIVEEMSKLRKKQSQLSINILKKKRRDALKALTADQYKRQRLMVHSKALVERKKNLQNRLLDEEDFKPLLEAFPCWAVTTYAISESLPLKPGLFDVVIIDEASQCDIASCFPALYRAKKAIVVGDDKQLAHLSFLEKAKEQSFFSHYDIPDKYQLMWRFRTNSVFDMANYYSNKPILLDEHYRSLPPIINFSNKEFYGDRIKVMSKELDYSNSIELKIIDNAKVDLDTTRNMPETEEILKKIQEVILSESESKNPSSIGVISPFRGQVELIKKALNQVLTEKTIKRHKIEVGTAHTFQGDEKDIIFLSFTLAENSHFQSLTFVQKPNLFNVAITRAKKKMYCYISKQVQNVQQGLLRSYLEYINNHQEETKISKIDIDELNSLQKELMQLLKEENIEVVPSFKSAGFTIDLVVKKENKQLAVELIGHSQKVTNMKKLSTLERCNWKIIPITAREFYYSKKACINKIKSTLN